MPGQMQTWSTRNSPGATGGGFGMQWSQHFQFGNTGTLNPFRPGIGQLGMPPALGTSPVNASQVHGTLSDEPQDIINAENQQRAARPRPAMRSSNRSEEKDW